MQVKFLKIMLTVSLVCNVLLGVYSYRLHAKDTENNVNEAVLFVNDGLIIEGLLENKNADTLKSFAHAKALTGIHQLLDLTEAEDVDVSSYENLKSKHAKLHDMLELIKKDVIGESEKVDIRRFLALYDSHNEKLKTQYPPQKKNKKLTK